MTFDRTTFPFGKSAFVAPADRDEFEALKTSIVDELKPFTYMQAVLVDELLQATWDLVRASKYGAPQAFIDRASRNWRRSRNALSMLYSAYAAAQNLLEREDSDACVDAPLANPRAIAKRGHAHDKKRLEQIKVQ